MNLILTMAGRYERFSREGFKTPKYLLPWGTGTILSVIVDELTRGRHFGHVFLVANHRDEAYMPHVRAIMRAHGIPREHLVMTHDTSGQAETAAIGVRALQEVLGPSAAPVVFHNIDTILIGRDLGLAARALQVADGFIDVFGSNNRSYSYVIADATGRVTEIAEKIVVSDQATSGMYGFGSPQAFLDHYRAGHDTYISAVYKHMITNGKYVQAGPLHHEADTIVLGTPDEYMNASLVFLER